MIARAEGAVIRGDLTDARGEPLPGVKIRAKIQFYGDDRLDGKCAYATTCAKGSFSFEGLVPERTYEIAVSAYDLPPEVMSVLPRISTPPHTDVHFVARTALRREVSLLDEDGDALAGAYVTWLDAEGDYAFTCSTNDLGVAASKRLDPVVTYSLRVRRSFRLPDYFTRYVFWQEQGVIRLSHADRIDAVDPWEPSDPAPPTPPGPTWGG